MKNRQDKTPDPGKIPKTGGMKKTPPKSREERHEEDPGVHPDQIREIFLDQNVALKRIIEKLQGISREKSTGEKKQEK